MSEKQQDQNAETVGMGIQFTTPIKASREQIWAAMVDKIYNTDKYLPVTDVKTTDIVPRQHTYREMTLNGKTLKENIYFDEQRMKIQAAIIGEDAVHINIYYPDTGILEYYQEDNKGERIPWHVPKALVLEAMNKTKQKAEASNA